MRFRSVVAFTMFLCAAVSASAQDPTAELAAAPKVRHRVRLQFPGDATKAQGTYPFEYALDRSDEFRALDDKKTFAASEQVKFTWPGLNPLRHRITASKTLADDPNAKQLADFVDTLLKLPALLTPKAQGGGSLACPANSVFADNLERIRDAVNAGASIDDSLKKWISDLDQPGAASARTVMAAIAAQSKVLKGKAAVARKLLEDLSDQRADTLSTTSLGGSGATTTVRHPLPAAPDALNQGAVPPPGGTGPKPPPGADPPAPPAVVQPAAKEWCDDFTEIRRAIQALLGVVNPIERVVQLEQLVTALDALQQELKPFAVDANWEGADYVFFSAEPLAASVTTIQIKAVRIDRPVDEVTHVVGLRETQAAAGSIVLRRYTRLIPEVAAGFVTTTVRQPKYGTATDAAGQMVVARKPDQDVSFAAAVLLNAVLAPRAESFALPMFQLGVSVAPDGPGILAGAGVRLTRPKRVALSAGVILAWVKDLQTLKIGGPVSGTTAIDADLAYEPTVKPYFALQFKF